MIIPLILIGDLRNYTNIADKVVATLGTYDIALDLGRRFYAKRDVNTSTCYAFCNTSNDARNIKFLSRKSYAGYCTWNCRNCRTCNGWQALRCTMCRGSGKVQYQVKIFSLKSISIQALHLWHSNFCSGEKATAESVADAISDNRAELVHLPSTVDLHLPLPSKDCPTCDGSGVMGCPECKNKLQIRISADDIMEPPWTAYNILRKMHYPYEASSCPSLRHERPQHCCILVTYNASDCGGFNYDDEVKQKIWWQYKESMRYDQLRDVVAKRIPGWEHLQETNATNIEQLLQLESAQMLFILQIFTWHVTWCIGGAIQHSILDSCVAFGKPHQEYFLSQALISIDPVRAREDPVVVKNVPYYKARKALEAEVMKLDPPPRPQNWGELNLPLNASSWSEEDLKDPKKLYEMTVLLNAQREIADQVLDAQWQTKWRQEKLNETLKEKVQPYIQSIDNGVLSQPIIIQSSNQDQKMLELGFEAQEHELLGLKETIDVFVPCESLKMSLAAFVAMMDLWEKPGNGDGGYFDVEAVSTTMYQQKDIWTAACQIFRHVFHE
ncbi:hypothetical protein CK203_101030 [Vitis vinifera]|uniref:RanBP2-type domain-containing protein n=1 Tax=Vitis vinifera TaxID=29760 RepID=A0A438CFD2_VITVI|nr:hypothetical protein CK203_101030 [Vitis vinifera]